MQLKFEVQFVKDEKISKTEDWKALFGLMSLDFCFGIQWLSLFKVSCLIGPRVNGLKPERSMVPCCCVLFRSPWFSVSTRSRQFLSSRLHTWWIWFWSYLLLALNDVEFSFLFLSFLLDRCCCIECIKLRFELGSPVSIR